MAAELFLRAKAIVLIAMLAGAEVSQAQHKVHTSNGDYAGGAGASSNGVRDFDLEEAMKTVSRTFPQLRELFTKPSGDPMLEHLSFPEQAQAFAMQMEAMSADPKFQDHVKLIAEQLEAVMADPNVQEQFRSLAQGFAKQAEAMSVDPKFQDHVKLITEQLEAIKAPSDVQEQFRALAQAFEKNAKVMSADPKFQDQAKLVAEQMEAVMADSDVQSQARALARQAEVLTEDPGFQEQVKSLGRTMGEFMQLVERLEAVTTGADSATQNEQRRRIARQLEEMIADGHAQGQTMLTHPALQGLVRQIEAMVANTRLQEHAERLAETLGATRLRDEPADGWATREEDILNNLERLRHEAAAPSAKAGKMADKAVHGAQSSMDALIDKLVSKKADDLLDRSDRKSVV